MTHELVEFLTARLDEDESYAKHDETPHSGPGSTARVLREVEAKRAIVRWGADVLTGIADAKAKNPRAWTGGNVAGPILRDIASVYADHPDYRAEWRS
jgi:hypothetical protein